MFRRPSSQTRLRIESLEVRCNLSAIAPLGDAPAEPAAEARQRISDDALGGWGNDWISGGTGQDSMIGGRGRDVLIANTGYDRDADTNGHGTHVAGTIGATTYAAVSEDSAARHELGHALGFRHEHTRPSSSGGDDLLIGGLTTHELSAEGADLAAGGDSAEAVITQIPIKVKHNV